MIILTEKEIILHTAHYLKSEMNFSHYFNYEEDFAYMVYGISKVMKAKITNWFGNSEPWVELDEKVWLVPKDCETLYSPHGMEVNAYANKSWRQIETELRELPVINPMLIGILKEVIHEAVSLYFYSYELLEKYFHEYNEDLVYAIKREVYKKYEKLKSQLEDAENVCKAFKMI